MFYKYNVWFAISQSSESKGEVDSTIFQADLCKAFLRNCSNLPTEMWKFLNNTASVCLSYVSPNCTKSLDISKNMSEFSRLFMSTTSMPPFRNSSDLSRLFMSTTSMPPFRNSSDLSRLFMSTTSMPPFRNSSDLSRLFMSTTSMPPFRNSSNPSLPGTSPQAPLLTSAPPLVNTGIQTITGEIPPPGYSPVLFSGCGKLDSSDFIHFCFWCLVYTCC